MHRLSEIPCRKLARTAVRGRNWKRRGRSNCVAIFYEEGKEGRISEKRTNFVVIGPPCTCGFGIPEKIWCGLYFLAYFCAVLRFPDLPTPPFKMVNNQGLFHLYSKPLHVHALYIDKKCYLECCFLLYTGRNNDIQTWRSLTLLSH